MECRFFKSVRPDDSFLRSNRCLAFLVKLCMNCFEYGLYFEFRCYFLIFFSLNQLFDLFNLRWVVLKWMHSWQIHLNELILLLHIHLLKNFSYLFLISGLFLLCHYAIDRQFFLNETVRRHFLPSVHGVLQLVDHFSNEQSFADHVALADHLPLHLLKLNETVCLRLLGVAHLRQWLFQISILLLQLQRKEGLLVLNYRLRSRQPHHFLSFLGRWVRALEKDYQFLHSSRQLLVLGAAWGQVSDKKHQFGVIHIANLSDFHIRRIHADPFLHHWQRLLDLPIFSLAQQNIYFEEPLKILPIYALEVDGRPQGFPFGKLGKNMDVFDVIVWDVIELEEVVTAVQDIADEVISEKNGLCV